MASYHEESTFLKQNSPEYSPPNPKVLMNGMGDSSDYIQTNHFSFNFCSKISTLTYIDVLIFLFCIVSCVWPKYSPIFYWKMHVFPSISCVYGDWGQYNTVIIHCVLLEIDVEQRGKFSKYRRCRLLLSTHSAPISIHPCDKNIFILLHEMNFT